jgi:putative ABC transport system permease protein
MSVIDGALARLRLIFGRRTAESRFESELRFHVDMEAERLVREEGIDPAEARRRAFVALGGVEKHRESLRDGRGTAWLAGLSLDTKLAMRMLVKYPALTFVGVLGLSVAVTIGALAFSAVNAVTATALPLDEGDRVIAIRNIDVLKNDDARQTHLHDMDTWRANARTIADLSAYRIAPVNLLLEGMAPVSVRAVEMSASGFRVARVAPAMGRYIRDDDARPGAPDVVVLGHDLWQKRLGGKADIVGTMIELGTRRHEVIGVMPAGFAFPENNQVWTPLRLSALDFRRGASPSLNVFARLAPGASLSAAQRELATIGERLARDERATHENVRTRVVPYAVSFLDTPFAIRLLHLVQVGVGFLLLIIGTNVAVIVYARTASRATEIAVRTALGASRRRIVGQLFAEAVALTGVAATVGLVVANEVFRRIEQMVRISADDQVPYWIHLEITPVTVVYAAGLAVVAAVIIGLIPALKATKHQVTDNLRGISGASMRLGKSWTALLVAQVAVSVMALPFAAQGSWTWIKMMLVDYGTPATRSFVIAEPLMSLDDPQAPDTMRMRVRQARYAQGVAELRRRLEALPGGGEVVAMSAIPKQSGMSHFELETLPTDVDSIRARSQHDARAPRVEASYFKAFDVPLLAGREFNPADLTPGANAIIVNRSYHAFYLGGGNALGRRVRLRPERPGENPEPWMEVVGVVEDFPRPVGTESYAPLVYLPMRTEASYPVKLAVRAKNVPLATLGDEIRKTAMSVDPGLRFTSIQTVESLMQQEADTERMALLGIMLVGLSVVLLASAGIYALMSFTVTRRRREIGIRSALGASRARVLLEILAKALKQIGLGIAIGSVTLTVIYRLAGDSGTYLELVKMMLELAGLMLVVGVLSTIGPARRALGVQPTEALKGE